MVFAAARTKSRALLGVALAYAAFAFVNPMWTTRAHDNGYLDWLAGLAVLAPSWRSRTGGTCFRASSPPRASSPIEARYSSG